MNRRRRRTGPPPPRRQSTAVQGRKPTASEVSKQLLDGAAVTALVSALSRDGWDVLNHRRRSVQRRGNDVSIVFQVTMQRGSEERVATAAVLWSTRPVPPGARTVVVAGLRLHVWRYPSDPFLPGLVRVTSKRRLRIFLDELAIAPGEVEELVRRVYRPTRRGVIEARLTSPEGDTYRIYCKVLGDRDVAKLAIRTREIATHHRTLAERVPVPEVLAVVEDLGLVVLAEAPGTTLRLAILDGEPAPTPAEVAGLALAISDLPIDSNADPRRYADPSRHASVLAGIVPSETSRIQAMVAQCIDLEGPLVTVHGDFHDGQVLVEDGRISGLLDVDGVGEGLLAHDAGRMIAYVESIGDIERADRPSVMAYSKGLQDAFADHVDAEVLARATAAAWIALATGPHRRQQTDWDASTRIRLDHAERWLASIDAI